MKKLLLVLLASFFLTATFAQYFQKGSWLAGGRTSLKFGSQDQGDGDKYHSTNFRFSPDVGYFFCAAFVVGLALEFESSSYHYNDDPSNKYNSFAAGLFTRYYFCKAAMKHNFFAEAGYHLGGYKDDNQNDRVNFNTLRLGLSYVCFLSTHVGLELGVDYRSTHDEGEPEDYKRFNSFGFCGGLQVYFDPYKKRPPVDIIR